MSSYFSCITSKINIHQSTVRYFHYHCVTIPFTPGLHNLSSVLDQNLSSISADVSNFVNKQSTIYIPQQYYLFLYEFERFVPGSQISQRCVALFIPDLSLLKLRPVLGWCECEAVLCPDLHQT